MKNRISIALACILLQGCSTVDDYMFGKDNTPQPKQLDQINSKVKVSQNWALPIGHGTKSNEYLKIKPKIQSGIIYTADTSGLVQAVHKKNGTRKWTAQLNHGIVSGPSVHHGFIAVSTNAATIALLSENDGKLLWQSKTSSEVLAPPVFSTNKVFAKTIDGKVFAFDLSTGKQIWMAEHGSPNLVLKASSSPIVAGNLLLIGFSDGKIDALDIDSGRMIWQRSIAYAAGPSDVDRLVDIDSDPIIKDNVAYLATYQGYVGALSLTDGQFIWRKPASVFKNILLSENNLYYTDSNDVVWSVNRKNGQVNWKQTALKARGLTEPALIGKDIVVGDKTGYLHFLEIQTGELIARSQVSGGVAASPNVHGKELYVLTDNGLLNNLSVS